MFDCLKNYERPVLLFSAGLDSTLLLAMLIEAQAQFDIVTFGREFWTREQKRRADELIKKFGLKIFSYPPMATSIIGQDDELAFVSQYAINGAVMPLVRDILPDTGTRCIAELDGLKVQASPFLWDLCILGSRQEDRHFAFEKEVIGGEWQTVNNTTLYAPFYGKDRAWIKAELELRGLDNTEVIETQDTGNLVGFCTNCLHGQDCFCPAENSIIPAVQWDKSAGLAAFRAAYGVSQ